MSKHCQHCGAEVQDSSVFCEYCGKNLSDPVVEENRQPLKSEKRCKTCGEIHDKTLKFCPNCGVKTHSEVKALLSALLICSILIMSAYLYASLTPTTNNESTVSQDYILYSDKYFNVEYMDFDNVPFVTACSLQLKVTNKSPKKLTLLLDDVYINNIAIESGTKMPITLEPGKVSTTPFILFTGNTGLSAEDITKLEFKLTARDDSFKLIHTSNKITLSK